MLIGDFMHFVVWNCSVKSSVVDKDGLRHLLLCRVILGKTELVPRDSNQCRSSSEEFDSGVDDLSNPKEYVIWCNQINTHVLPEYVLSFRFPSPLKGVVFVCVFFFFFLMIASFVINS